MNYKEVIIGVKNDQLLREQLMARLLDIGYNSFMEDDDFISAYIDISLFDENKLCLTLSIFKGKAVIQRFEDLPDQNWNAVWESNYEPVIIDNQCVVRAPFHSKPENIAFDIVIQPKMSFGTAHHETTYLMLHMMLAEDFRGKKVLDMGSGTGVLSVMAAMKGARSVVAIDNDEWAFYNGIENGQLNGVQNIEYILGDANSIPEVEFNILLANINRNILLEDLGNYNHHLAESAIIFLSGFYLADLSMIVAEAEKHQWELTAHKTRNQWVVAKFQANLH